MTNKTRVKAVDVKGNKMDKDIYDLESKEIVLKQALFVARQKQISNLEKKIESLNISLQKTISLLKNTHLQASTKLKINNLKKEIKNIKAELIKEKQKFKETKQLEKIYLDTKKVLLKEKTIKARADKSITKKSALRSSKRNKALQKLSPDLNKPVTKTTKNIGKKWIPKKIKG